MQLHIFTTDATALKLIDLLPAEDQVSCIIVPSNRLDSKKVKKIRKDAHRLGILVEEQTLNLPIYLPPANMAISWLYSQIIDLKDLKRYPNGILNMHGGKIPQYRGASVLHWAIINGEQEMGITWHEIIEKVDAGPIWKESTIPIPVNASSNNMRIAMIKEGLNTFSDAWMKFKSKNSQPRIPDISSYKIWPQRKPEDGYIMENWSEQQVRNYVRALCDPWPPAFVIYKGKKRYIEEIFEISGYNRIPYKTAENKIIYLQQVTKK